LRKAFGVGFSKSLCLPQARTDFRTFFKQVFNSGMARINLSVNHKGSLKIVHLLPAGFVVAMCVVLLLSWLYPVILFLPLLYSIAILFDSFFHENSARVALLSVVAAWVQLFGYGLGFMYALLWVFTGKT
jgi:hypothetical protein